LDAFKLPADPGWMAAKDVLVAEGPAALGMGGQEVLGASAVTDPAGAVLPYLFVALIGGRRQVLVHKGKVVTATGRAAASGYLRELGFPEHEPAPWLAFSALGYFEVLPADVYPARDYRLEAILRERPISELTGLGVTAEHAAEWVAEGSGRALHVHLRLRGPSPIDGTAAGGLATGDRLARLVVGFDGAGEVTRVAVEVREGASGPWKTVRRIE